MLYFKLGGENGGLCFKFLGLVIFNYISLFYDKISDFVKI